MACSLLACRFFLVSPGNCLLPHHAANPGSFILVPLALLLLIRSAYVAELAVDARLAALGVEESTGLAAAAEMLRRANRRTSRRAKRCWWLWNRRVHQCLGWRMGCHGHRWVRRCCSLRHQWRHRERQISWSWAGHESRNVQWRWRGKRRRLRQWRQVMQKRRRLCKRSWLCSLRRNEWRCQGSWLSCLRRHDWRRQGSWLSCLHRREHRRRSRRWWWHSDPSAG